MGSRSYLDIDLAAIAANAKTLQARAPKAELCAVVKADGYGHGAVAAARAALGAGATRLAVAQVDEGRALRAAGFDVPIWVLSEPARNEFHAAAGAGLEPAVYTPEGIRAAAWAGPLTVHLKLDTGMHRVGAAPVDAVELAQRIDRARKLTLGSVWTHLASADVDAERTPASADPAGARPFTDRQLDRFDGALNLLGRAGIDVPLRHAANSAGTIAHPRSHYDVIRCGISLYGLPPSPGLTERAPLQPALSWRSRVSYVKRLARGDGVSYGQRSTVAAPTMAATFPVGYADGYRRDLWETGPGVLIRGKRRPILGVVTMDQTVVDCGDEPVSVGDEVVLIGRQGEEEISVDELAANLGTISYEIPVAIGARVERRHRGG